MSIKSSWRNSPWAVAFGGAFFGFLLTIVYDLLKSKPVLTTISLVVNKAWYGFIYFLDFELKVWWIISGILILLLILYVISRAQTNKIKEPEFYNYREDTLKTWKWRWHYVYQKHRNQWAIVELTPFCPKCRTPMLTNKNRGDFWYSCPRCSYRASTYINSEEYESPQDIEALIIYNIEQRQYQNTN